MGAVQTRPRDVPLRLALVILLILAPGPAPAASSDFVSGMDDVPLMAGLAEDPDAAVVFDKPSGRIVEAAAKGAVTAGEVAAFYRRSLPELGWHLMESGRTKTGQGLRFRQDEEMLTIRFESTEGRTRVHFSLAPAPDMP